MFKSILSHCCQLSIITGLTSSICPQYTAPIYCHTYLKMSSCLTVSLLSIWVPMNPYKHNSSSILVTFFFFSSLYQQGGNAFWWTDGKPFCLGGRLKLTSAKVGQNLDPKRYTVWYYSHVALSQDQGSQTNITLFNIWSVYPPDIPRLLS